MTPYTSLHITYDTLEENIIKLIILCLELKTKISTDLDGDTLLTILEISCHRHKYHTLQI